MGYSTAKTKVRAAAAIVFAGALLVACGSSSTKTSTSTTGPYGGTASTPSVAATGAAVVMTKTGTHGTYLTDASGKSLYLFAADTGGTSVCNGSCAAIWPPLTTTGNPSASAGVTGSMLTTFKRQDGSTQVVYNGHPLYYYTRRHQSRGSNGQGLNLNGGLWWLVSPAGAAIQK